MFSFEAHNVFEKNNSLYIMGIVVYEGGDNDKYSYPVYHTGKINCVIEHESFDVTHILEWVESSPEFVPVDDSLLLNIRDFYSKQKIFWHDLTKESTVHLINKAFGRKVVEQKVYAYGIPCLRTVQDIEDSVRMNVLDTYVNSLSIQTIKKTFGKVSKHVDENKFPLAFDRWHYLSYNMPSKGILEGMNTIKKMSYM